jgi:hypothetical protein
LSPSDKSRRRRHPNLDVLFKLNGESHLKLNGENHLKLKGANDVRRRHADVENAAAAVEKSSVEGWRHIVINRYWFTFSDLRHIVNATRRTNIANIATAIDRPTTDITRQSDHDDMMRSK